MLEMSLRLGLNGGAVGAVTSAIAGAITRAAIELVADDVISVIDDDINIEKHIHDLYQSC